MVNLSRRSFLIGTSAAVAAIALPVAISEIVPLVTDREFVWRRYFDIMVGGTGEQSEVDGVRTVSIFRQRSELPILKFAMNNRGSYRWSVWNDMDKIIIPYKDALRIDVEGGYPCKMDLEYEEKKLDGSIKLYVELHSFPSNGPPEIYALEA